MNDLKLKFTLAKMPSSSSLNRQSSIRFGEASFELLSDFLSTLNNQNKSNLENVSGVCGNFKNKRVVGGSNFPHVAYFRIVYFVSFLTLSLSPTL